MCDKEPVDGSPFLTGHGISHTEELPSTTQVRQLLHYATKWDDNFNLLKLPISWWVEDAKTLQLLDEITTTRSEAKERFTEAMAQMRYAEKLDELRDWLRSDEKITAQGFANRVYTLSKAFKFTEREILLHLTECTEE